MSVKVVTIDLAPAGGSQFTRAMKVSILQSIVLDPGPLMDATIQLVTNAATLNPASVVGDIALPTWTGYVPGELEPNPATPAGVYGATVEYVSVDWESAANADVTVDGVALLNSSGALTGYGVFDSPVPVLGIQTITVVLTLLVE